MNKKSSQMVVNKGDEFPDAMRKKSPKTNKSKECRYNILLTIG